MPSPEQSGEPQEGSERWYQARRYANELASRRPYNEAQEAIYQQTETDLSAYRFQLDTVYHVAVLGGKPVEAVEQIIMKILSTGEPVELEEPLLDALFERQRQLKKMAGWVEGHYDERVAPRIAIPKKKRKRCRR